MAEDAAVGIQPAKGRPWLTWVGKLPLRNVTPLPAQPVEVFDPSDDGRQRAGGVWDDWPEEYHRGGLLFQGDCKDVLAHLLVHGFRGKVKLVYIDPPFDSGADYVRRVKLRGPTARATLEGEPYSLGEQIQYTDIWANDNYLQFMYERLLLIKEIMAEDGILVVHMDETRGHYIKVMLDEVFGAEHYINEVVWRRQTAHSDVGQGAKHLGRIHDTLFFYSKGEQYTWHELFTPYSQEYIERFYRHTEEGTGRRYQLGDLTAPGASSKGNPYYEFMGISRYWRYSKEKMEELYRQGRIVQPENGGVPRLKRYLDEMPGVPLQDIWDDIMPVQSQSAERTDFPTQKPEALLERILELASNPGDIVLDCFVGSGTTAAVAQKLGRRWIACDVNKGAVQTTSKRLKAIIERQLEDVSRALGGQPAGHDTLPAQLSFAVYRVNNYDLSGPHEEIARLVRNYLDINPLPADHYFDGTRGGKLVKIIPLTRPLTLLDLEELKRELEARPQEARDIELVCLGKELAVDDWLARWNNEIRRQGDAPNKINVIELRTDQKYGRFFVHQRAQADVDIRREGDRIVVQVHEFCSPTIIERLRHTAGAVTPQVDDWRAMVDYIEIDPAYDGEAFNVCIYDHPPSKRDFVQGRYELQAPPEETTVAVKIVDMLGEEVLVAKRV